MIAREELIEFYRYFFVKRYKSYKYKFQSTENTEKAISTFFELIHEAYDIHTLGLNWLWNYFIFQYTSYDSMEKRKRKGMTDTMIPSFMFAKTSFLRWKNRNPEFDFTITENIFPVTYHISKEILFAKLEKQEKNNFDPDKKIRAKFLNTEKGFALCIEYTTLYNPRDTSCILCKNKTICMNLLKANYPALFQERTAKK